MEATRFEQEVQAIEDILREMYNHTDDDWFQSQISTVSIAMDTLRELYDEAFIVEDEEEYEEEVEEEEECEEEAADEGLSEKEEFMLQYNRLVGLAEQFTALGRKRPESACGSFKAQQVNRILFSLKELTGIDMGFVSEEGEQSYGDVSLLLRGWLDQCADYAWRHFDGNAPTAPPKNGDYDLRLKQERILEFCHDEPKSILEIAEMLCYRDKKTVRKYLDPLLANGWLARTVPDKPNSRNQKYITARVI